MHYIGASCRRGCFDANRRTNKSKSRVFVTDCSKAKTARFACLGCNMLRLYGESILVSTENPDSQTAVLDPNVAIFAASLNTFGNAAFCSYD